MKPFLCLCEKRQGIFPGIPFHFLFDQLLVCCREAACDSIHLENLSCPATTASAPITAATTTDATATTTPTTTDATATTTIATATTTTIATATTQSLQKKAAFFCDCCGQISFIMRHVFLKNAMKYEAYLCNFMR